MNQRHVATFTEVCYGQVAAVIYDFRPKSWNLSTVPIWSRVGSADLEAIFVTEQSH